MFVTDIDSNPPKKRKGRGITKLDDIFARPPSMPKIKITLNKYGQPVGKNARKFSSVIGCQVRKTISVACVDWRLVDADTKYKVWITVKVMHCIIFLSYIMHGNVVYNLDLYCIVSWLI